MATKKITTFGEAATECGVYPHTIGDLVKKLGIKPQLGWSHGNAKGLTAADMRLIRRALGLTRKRRQSVPA